MKLKDYFEENCVNVKLFARKIGVSVATIYSIIDGYDIRLSTALKISKATKGKVKCEDMEPTKSPKPRASKSEKGEQNQHPNEEDQADNE